MNEDDIKRRKPEANRKAKVLTVRLTAEHHGLMKTAADAAGLGLSGWLRMVGLEAARKAPATRGHRVDDVDVDACE